MIDLGTKVRINFKGYFVQIVFIAQLQSIKQRKGYCAILASFLCKLTIEIQILKLTIKEAIVNFQSHIEKCKFYKSNIQSLRFLGTCTHAEHFLVPFKLVESALNLVSGALYLESLVEVMRVLSLPEVSYQV